ncbi:MAG TPA: M1 family metallopeptidase [Flavipsychrobacter sp.]|nr:M1 family metallopeptidase [Flavipsychrobacter sp.]
MKQILLPLGLFLVSQITSAQSYWQQKVDTRIEVSLDDKGNMLRGFEELTYHNNAPDTLHYLYFHLWPNAYSHDHTAFAEQQYRNGHTGFYYADAAARGFIDSIQFVIEGNEVAYFYGERTPDIARIDLPHPLLPGQSVKITTPFRVKIPEVFSRLGHTGQAYFISQWFPKPAVYDKKGWHPIPYLDQGEFYSEFGSYDVSITLPKNYVVMATGNLQTASEIKWLDSLAQMPVKMDSQKTFTIIKNVNGAPKKVVTKINFPESATELKTIRFTEDNIHDFAWFADKRWVVRKDTVTSPGTDDVITTWAAFLPKYEKNWSKANEYLKEAVTHYGKWVGPYPYRTIKAVQGDMKAGGGMEYPTIAIIDINEGNRTTIVHEAGHNWFYGMLASNERDHAWMDEGINTFYEQRTNEALRNSDTTKTKQGGKKKQRTVSIDVSMYSILYELAASANDQAIEQTSNNFKEINYGMDVYYKTATMLRWLESYMGKENFDAGMKDYYNTWKFKHPYPGDFQKVMQQHTDKPIDWFFEEALTTDRLVNFSIQKVKNTNNGIEVLVKNKANGSFPVAVSAYHGDSLLATSTSLPFSNTTSIQLSDSAASWTSIRISKDIPDGRTQNNTYRRSGVFHRTGLALRPFVGTNLGQRQKVFVMPAIGYNLYDGFETGLLFHNLTWPETRLKFAIAPMYGFKSKSLIGAGSASYSWYPRNTFKEIFLQLDAKTFSYNETNTNITRDLFARYIKLAPSLNFVLKEPIATSSVNRTLTIKGYYIQEDNFNYDLDLTDSLYKPSIGKENNMYGLIRYTHSNDRTFNPFTYSIEGQVGESFAKLSMEGNIKINYNTRGKSLYARVYGGKFFGFNDDASQERYYLNSIFTGMSDYLYDDTYIGRSEQTGFSARQISIREGGMKIPTFMYLSSYGIGRSDNWLAAINLKSDLPLKKLPIRLFIDAATFADASKLNPSENKILFDGGFELYLLDIINIYVPLVRSQDYNDYRKSITGKTSILDGVTFSLNLQRINWLKTPTYVFKILGY